MSPWNVADELEKERDALLAENRRLREALERIRIGGFPAYLVADIAREALAGDAE